MSIHPDDGFPSDYADHDSDDMFPNRFYAEGSLRGYDAWKTSSPYDADEPEPDSVCEGNPAITPESKIMSTEQAEATSTTNTTALATREPKALAVGELVEMAHAGTAKALETVRRPRVGGLTEAQLALRRTGIGGSEVGALLGLSPWARPIDVWRAKVEGHELEETLPMKRGRLLEPSIAAWYAEDMGAELHEVGTLRHPSSSVLLATPDRIACFSTGEQRVLEIKSPGYRMAEEWGEAGTDRVPKYYLVQVAAEMGCAGLERADLAALIGGEDFRIYNLKRNLDLEAMIIEAAERFHRDFVVTRKPPPPDASDTYSEWLASRYPSVPDAERVLPATPDAGRWAVELFAARLAKEEAEEKETLARQHLEAAIGPAYGIEGAGWRIIWAESKGKPSTNWEALCAEAGISKALVEKHTKAAPHRMFRPTLKKPAASKAKKVSP